MSKTYPLTSRQIGDFIDAVVNDRAGAARMLEVKPALRDARWLHDESCLHFLAVEGFVDGTRWLCEQGFDVNVRNKFDDTALYDVIRLGHVELAGLLLRHGATLEITESWKESYVVAALNSKNLALLDLLLAAGARPTTKDVEFRYLSEALPQKEPLRSRMIEVLTRYGITVTVEEWETWEKDSGGEP